MTTETTELVRNRFRFSSDSLGSEKAPLMSGRFIEIDSNCQGDNIHLCAINNLGDHAILFTLSNYHDGEKTISFSAVHNSLGGPYVYNYATTLYYRHNGKRMPSIGSSSRGDMRLATEQWNLHVHHGCMPITDVPEAIDFEETERKFVKLIQQQIHHRELSIIPIKDLVALP